MRDSAGEWRGGIWDCFSQFWPSCVLATCCPCVLFGQLVSATRAWGPKSACLMAGTVFFLLSSMLQLTSQHAGNPHHLSRTEFFRESLRVRAHEAAYGYGHHGDPQYEAAMKGVAMTEHTGGLFPEGTPVIRSLLVMCVLLPLCAMKIQLRQTVVRSRRIAEERSVTIFKAICCSCCSLAQMARLVFHERSRSRVPRAPPRAPPRTPPRTQPRTPPRSSPTAIRPRPRLARPARYETTPPFSLALLTDPGFAFEPLSAATKSEAVQPPGNLLSGNAGIQAGGLDPEGGFDGDDL